MNTAFYRFLLSALLVLSLTTGCTKEDPETKFQEHTKQAQQLVTEKKWQEARIHLMSAIDLKPREAETYFQLGEVLMHLEKYGAALENYRSAVNFNPNHIQARLRVASLMLASNETELAESEARQVLEREPKNSEAIIVIAAIESTRTKFDHARELLQDVLSREPKNATAVASLGDIAMKEGKLEEAEKYLKQALEIKPDNGPVLLELADLNIRQNHYDEAQKLLEGMLIKAPENSQLRFLLAEFFLSRGMSDRAQAEYKKVIETDPLQHVSRDRLYDMYLANNDAPAAFALTKALEAKAPQDPVLPYFKGRELELQHNNDGALALYLKTIEGSRNFAPAFRRAGTMELAGGKPREGLEHLNQAISVDAFDVGARLTLGQYYFSRGEFSKALDHVNKILQRFPRQLGANILRADLALVEGKADLARHAYEVLTEAFPNSPVGWFKLGILEESQNNHDKAIENYEKALSFDTGIMSPARHLAQVIIRKDGAEAALKKLQSLKEKSQNSKPEYDFLIGSLLAATPNATADQIAQARRSLEESVRARPMLIDAYTVLAQLDAREGNFKSAITQYKRLVEAQPQSITYNMLLAVSYESDKQAQNAADTYRKVLDINARFGPAANNLAWLMAEELNGNLDEALRLAQIAKEELTNDPNVADTIGWINYKKGSYRTALTFLNEAVDLIHKDDPKATLNPELLYHLGATKIQLEDQAGGKANLQQALEIGGKDFSKRQAIEKMLSESPTTSATQAAPETTTAPAAPTSETETTSAPVTQ